MRTSFAAARARGPATASDAVPAATHSAVPGNTGPGRAQGQQTAIPVSHSVVLPRQSF